MIFSLFGSVNQSDHGIVTDKRDFSGISEKKIKRPFIFKEIHFSS